MHSHIHPADPHESAKANLALLLAVAIWGSSFVMVKDLLNILSPAGMVGLRFCIATPLFLLCLWQQKQLSALKTHAKEGLLLGLPLVMVFESQTLGMAIGASASNSAFITGMSVVFTPLVGWLLIRQKPRGSDGLLGALSILGMGFLTLDFSKSLIPAPGDLMTLLTAFAQAFHIIMTHRLVRDGGNAYALLFWQFLMVALVSVGTAPFFDHGLGRLELLGLMGWGTMVYLAIFPAFLTYLVQTVVQVRVEPMHLALMYSLEPIFASLFAVYFLLEEFGWQRLTGAGILLATCLLSEWLNYRRKKKETVTPAN